jgi:hypothetical protein
MERRGFIIGVGTAFTTASGCLSGENSSQPAHTVTVYLGDREATQNVTVTVKDESEETLFEKEYSLSDENEADEDATFPESTEPETVTVGVDGNEFERQWPGFEEPEMPCEGENRAGVEIWIENSPDGDTDVRMESNCQHVTIEGNKTE